MSAHLLYDQATGEAVSTCSRDDGVADPLPAGLVDLPISDADFDGFVGGWLAWDAATLTFVATGKPTPAQELVRAANFETIGQNLQAAMSDLAAIVSSPDVAEVPTGSLTNAQRDAAIRTLRDVVQQQQVALRRLALNERRIIRHLRSDLDTAE